MKRIAIDTNAVVDLLRPDRTEPPHLRGDAVKFLPLPVLAELLVGAKLSQRPEENVSVIERLEQKWTLLSPDQQTARVYATITSAFALSERSAKKERGRRNDLWIAALCVQHELPLLSNNRDFDQIEGLTVIHW